METTQGNFAIKKYSRQKAPIPIPKLLMILCNFPIIEHHSMYIRSSVERAMVECNGPLFSFLLETAHKKFFLVQHADQLNTYHLLTVRRYRYHELEQEAID